jgi:hypothetical protein
MNEEKSEAELDLEDALWDLVVDADIEFEELAKRFNSTHILDARNDMIWHIVFGVGW